MPANPERGEVVIMIRGEEHVLRPTWQAICEMEEGTKKPIMQLFTDFSTGRFSAHDLCIVLAASLSGAGAQGITYNKVGEIIMELGLGNNELLAALGKVIRSALEGGIMPGESKALDRK